MSKDAAGWAEMIDKDYVTVGTEKSILLLKTTAVLRLIPILIKAMCSKCDQLGTNFDTSNT